MVLNYHQSTQDVAITFRLLRECWLLQIYKLVGSEKALVLMFAFVIFCFLTYNNFSGPPLYWLVQLRCHCSGTEVHTGEMHRQLHLFESRWGDLITCYLVCSVGDALQACSHGKNNYTYKDSKSLMSYLLGLIEFIDRRYSQSCWYFDALLSCELAPL